MQADVMETIAWNSEEISLDSIWIFDYDGVLHETLKVYKPAIEKVVGWLSSEHGIKVEMPSEARIRSWLGMSTTDMWEDFCPHLPSEIKSEAGAFVGAVMRREILAGNGSWYPGVTGKLDKFKAEGRIMAVLSNCDRAYAQLNWEAFDMGKWFVGFYDCGSYGWASKADVIEKVAQELAEKNCGAAGSDPAALGHRFVVVGDRRSDRDAAERIGARYIWCEYGYGTREEMEDAPSRN